MTNLPLEQLYHQQMKNLINDPQYKTDEPLKNIVTCRNPMCGDIISMGYLSDNNIVHWSGEGCLLCLSSAEALCQTIAENDVPQNACNQIEDFFNGEQDTLPEKFLPLSSVKETPSRIKCVTLSIRTFKKLADETKRSTG